MFPKLRKRSPHGSCDSVSDKEDDEATDYVFRILFPGNQMEFGKCFQPSCSPPSDNPAIITDSIYERIITLIPSLGPFPSDAFIIVCNPSGCEDGVSGVTVLLSACIRSGPGADRTGCEHLAADSQKVVLFVLLAERLLRRLPSQWLQPGKVGIPRIRLGIHIAPV